MNEQQKDKILDILDEINNRKDVIDIDLNAHYVILKRRPQLYVHYKELIQTYKDDIEFLDKVLSFLEQFI